MKFQLIVVSSVLLLVASVAITICNSTSVSGAQNEASTSTSKYHLSLPKLFDFAKFKKMFNKTYKSLVEEIAREKIFLGRAFRAFLSKVKFNSNKRPTFYRINSMSDLTEEEKKAMYNNHLSDTSKLNRVSGGDKDKISSTKTTDTKDVEPIQTPAMDSIETVKAKLDNIAEIDQDVAKGLENLQQENEKRSKRSTLDDEEKTLTLEELYNSGFTPVVSHGDDDLSNDYSHSSSSSSYATSDNGNNFFSSMLDFFKNPMDKKKSSIILRNDLPNEIFIDHRKTNCFTPIESQGLCGSCYIFATMAIYEFQYCKETKNNLIFSKQFLLDCGERIGNKLPGCRGGNELMIEQFLDQMGVELSSNYVYRARSDECPYQPANLDVSKMGQYKLYDTSLYSVDMEDWEEKLKDNPITVHVWAPTDFGEFGGGIDLGDNCDPSQGHAMVIVGSGRQGDINYWILRNSYGPDWGEDGYWRLDKKATSCFGNDGTGYQIRGNRVFEHDVNPDYDDQYVKKRKEDVEQGKSINKNPFTYVDINELVGSTALPK